MLKNRLVAAILLVIIADVAQASLSELPIVSPPALVEMEKVKLRLVSRQVVCQRISEELTRYGVSIGLNKSTSQLYALESTQKVIANFRLGDRHEFVDMRTLPFHQEITPKPENSFLNLVGILGNSLGLQGRVIMGFDVNELRFLPQVQLGSEIIMVVRNTEGMTADRAKTVVAVANKLQVKVSIVWVGAAAPDATGAFDQDALAYLAAVTGGTYVDLGGNREPCSQIL
jgi:hypothetical protein